MGSDLSMVRYSWTTCAWTFNLYTTDKYLPCNACMICQWYYLIRGRLISVKNQLVSIDPIKRLYEKWESFLSKDLSVGLPSIPLKGQAIPPSPQSETSSNLARQACQPCHWQVANLTNLAKGKLAKPTATSLLASSARWPRRAPARMARLGLKVISGLKYQKLFRILNPRSSNPRIQDSGSWWQIIFFTQGRP